MESMTIKELAQVAGVSTETIRRTSKELFPESLKKGRLTVFSKAQCFDIIQKVPKKNMVNMDLPQPVAQPAQNVEVIAQAVAIAMQSVMMPIMEKLLNNQKALPEPTREDSYSLVAYCKINQIKVNRSELALHGRSLKKIATREGIELKKITDERWGFVNSYPVEILKEYFSA